MPAADIVIRVTVILLAALITTRLMRRATAATRHLVWMLAVVGALLIPIATAIVPEWRVLRGVDLKADPYGNPPTHAPA